MITVAAFDFERKAEETLAADGLATALAAGRYCWVDVLAEARPAVESCLRDLGVNDLAVAEVVGPDREGRYDVYEDCLHFAVTEARLEAGRLVTVHVDVVLTARAVVTVRRAEAEFLRNMRRVYREDFLKFARTPGFLLYELSDHLLDIHRRTHQGFTDVVEQAQLRLFGTVDDDIFRSVAGLMSDLLVFRKVVMAARELMHELASRRSPFVSETTQPFLENHAVALGRLGGDLATEREVLSETLNLYMGMVSHRTNKFVTRLTVISVVFLPLTFLCGVYGMNLNIPETQWKYGYLAFWLVVLAVAGILLALMRRAKWL